ncbi:hypothetical protein KMW28_21600 [Flammeovirga yaeyamensis]|uniref:Uncharacterized protein n=1 Tax=Flammeovirga yaeyamensis TaxID=367791 RepID=A0AAX1NEC0_9BACT|nr:hypothetical protein [Flammeovirga yaeyamensis]MBB3697051.1 hypothetical protein [Flammeovirga yaeyamensis]NMF33713.1 hypothetical protein [Flammeovirga yaeyamensis]QWG05021.1 hypothetical protein KMW28_21600 [Flammeovirga yaeyamensis]
MELLRLNDGNQTEVIYYSKSKKDLFLENDFDWVDYDFEDNPYSRLVEYIDENSNTPSTFKNNNDFQNYWLKLNRPQKVIWLFGILQTYVYSVVIDEFFYNFYYFSHAVIDILNELDLKLELSIYHQELYYFVNDETNKQFIQDNMNDIKPYILEQCQGIKTKNDELLGEGMIKQIHKTLFDYIVTNKKYFFQ